MAGRLTLRTYLKQVLEEDNLSLGAVERNSRKHGDKGISKDYVSNLLSGESDNPSPEKLVALAKGIQRPFEEVLEAMFGKIKKEEANYRDTTIRLLLTEFNSLSSTDQKELKPTIDMLLKEIRRRKRSADSSG